MSTDKITFLLNWHATPYHAPIFLAQSKGFFAAEGIKVAILGMLAHMHPHRTRELNAQSPTTHPMSPKSLDRARSTWVQRP